MRKLLVLVSLVAVVALAGPAAAQTPGAPPAPEAPATIEDFLQSLAELLRQLATLLENAEVPAPA